MSSRLEELTLDIKSLGEKLDNDEASSKEVSRRVIERRIAIGTRLIEVKEIVGHGNFKSWIENSFPRGLKTAENWMAFARVAGGMTVEDPVRFLTELICDEENPATITGVCRAGTRKSIKEAIKNKSLSTEMLRQAVFAPSPEKSERAHRRNSPAAAKKTVEDPSEIPSEKEPRSRWNGEAKEAFCSSRATGTPKAGETEVAEGMVLVLKSPDLQAAIETAQRERKLSAEAVVEGWHRLAMAFLNLLSGRTARNARPMPRGTQPECDMPKRQEERSDPHNPQPRPEESMGYTGLVRSYVNLAEKTALLIEQVEDSEGALVTGRQEPKGVVRVIGVDDRQSKAVLDGSFDPCMERGVRIWFRARRAYQNGVFSHLVGLTNLEQLPQPRAAPSTGLISLSKKQTEEFVAEVIALDKYRWTAVGLGTSSRGLVPGRVPNAVAGKMLSGFMSSRKRNKRVK